MTVRTARGFLPTLRELERGLAMPLPVRTRILRELEFDLEELQARLMVQGLSANEAQERALEALLPDRRVLHELGRLHESWYRRATGHLGERRLRVVERAALALSTASVLVAQTVALLHANLLNDPSPYLWPILALGAALFGIVLRKAFALWVKGDHDRPDHGISGILGLSAVILGVASGGVILDFYHLASVLEASSAQADALVIKWIVRDSALLSVAFLLALGGGLMWLVFTQWLALVSGEHHEVLGLEPDSIPPVREKK